MGRVPFPKDLASPMLPVEMWFSVIDQLRDDPHALAACSLTCRSWRTVAHLHLFYTVLLKDISAYMRFWRLLERLLEKFPDISPYVHDLTIAMSPTLAVVGAHTSLDPVMPRMLLKLDHVEVLTLVHWRAIHMSEDTRSNLQAFFPSLRVLNLVVRERLRQAARRVPQAHRRALSSRQAGPPFLDGPPLQDVLGASLHSAMRRTIDAVTVFNDSQPVIPANGWILEDPFEVRLRRLEAMWDSAELVTILGLSLGDLLQASGTALEHLNLAIQSTFVSPRGHLTLSHNPNLRSLTLTDVNVRGRSASDWLREFLALIQPTHASLRLLEIGLNLAGPSDVPLLQGWSLLDRQLADLAKDRRELVITFRLRPMRPPLDLDAWTRDTANEVVKRLPYVRAGRAWLRVVGAPYRYEMYPFEMYPQYGTASSSEAATKDEELELWFRG